MLNPYYEDKRIREEADRRYEQIRKDTERIFKGRETAPVPEEPISVKETLPKRKESVLGAIIKKPIREFREQSTNIVNTFGKIRDFINTGTWASDSLYTVKSEIEKKMFEDVPETNKIVAYPQLMDNVRKAADLYGLDRLNRSSFIISEKEKEMGINPEWKRLSNDNVAEACYHALIGSGLTAKQIMGLTPEQINIALEEVIRLGYRTRIGQSWNDSLATKHAENVARNIMGTTQILGRTGTGIVRTLSKIENIFAEQMSKNPSVTEAEKKAAARESDWVNNVWKKYDVQKLSDEELDKMNPYVGVTARLGKFYLDLMMGSRILTTVAPALTPGAIEGALTQGGKTLVSDLLPSLPPKAA